MRVHLYKCVSLRVGGGWGKTFQIFLRANRCDTRRLHPSSGEFAAAKRVPAGRNTIIPIPSFVRKVRGRKARTCRSRTEHRHPPSFPRRPGRRGARTCWREDFARRAETVGAKHRLPFASSFGERGGETPRNGEHRTPAAANSPHETTSSPLPFFVRRVGDREARTCRGRNTVIPLSFPRAWPAQIIAWLPRNQRARNTDLLAGTLCPASTDGDTKQYRLPFSFAFGERGGGTASTERRQTRNTDFSGKHELAAKDKTNKRTYTSTKVVQNRRAQTCRTKHVPARQREAKRPNSPYVTESGEQARTPPLTEHEVNRLPFLKDEQTAEGQAQTRGTERRLHPASTDLRCGTPALHPVGMDSRRGTLALSGGHGVAARNAVRQARVNSVTRAESGEHRGSHWTLLTLRIFVHNYVRKLQTLQHRLTFARHFSNSR